MQPEPTYFCGLDLGQAQDFTALAVLEKPVQKPGDKGRPVYSVRHLERWELGTPYTEIVKDVAKRVERPPLRDSLLIVDKTGVGTAVVDMFTEARLPVRLRPALITSGHAVTPGEGGGVHVPKIELASTLQALLQARRLLIVQSLPEAAVLGQELATFRVKVTTAGNETFEAWRERDHDDLVLAVALAAWWAETMHSESYITCFEVPLDPNRRRGYLFPRRDRYMEHSDHWPIV